MRRFQLVVGMAGMMMLTCLGHADEIYIVGSSTVFPYANVVKEGFLVNHKSSQINIDVTGTGNGFKLFCLHNNDMSPDITNASHRITGKVLEQCSTHGVPVVEVLIGYDGIALVQSKRAPAMKLSSQTLFLALAAFVPDKETGKLMKNPYFFWDAIDENLPHRKILFYGPPKGAGTYDTLKDKLIVPESQKLKNYQQAGYTKYKHIRSDGAYINDHEQHEKVIPDIIKSRDAIGIFGQSPFRQHQGELVAISLNGIAPANDTIVSGAYALSRPLYFYINKNHLNNKPILHAFIDYFMSDKMLGQVGVCVNKGLVPLQKSVLGVYRRWIQYSVPLTPMMLHAG